MPKHIDLPSNVISFDVRFLAMNTSSVKKMQKYVFSNAKNIPLSLI
jgi:hypothetical protein